MSYTSQAVNNRSMNGIISFDDGSGGVLENGRLTCVHMSSGTSTYDTLQVGELDATDIIVSGTITNAALTNQLLLKDDITSVNSKLLLKADKTYTDDQLLLKDNITSVNSKLLLKADKTYTDDQLLLKDNITSVDSKLLLKADKTYTDAQLLLKDNITSVNSKLLLKDDVTSVDSKCLNLQNQINGILNDPSIESITIGTVTKLTPDQLPYVTNVGTAKDQILNFGIPQGYKGDTGNKGDTGDKGDKGSKGDDGKDGSNGDSSAATAAAIAAAASAGVAAAAASSAAGSAAASAASAALAQLGIQELEVEVAGIQTQIDTLGEAMITVDNDILLLKDKTQYQTASLNTTYITSTLETGNIVSSGTLYTAGDATITGSVTANNFTGGLLSTNIKGANINIGTNETLINTIQIGGASTITTINGLVNYTNPFNNFFAQF